MSELDMRRVNSLYDCRGYQRVELSLEQRVRQGGVFPHTVLGRQASNLPYYLSKVVRLLRVSGEKFVGPFLVSYPLSPMLEDVFMNQLAL